MSEQTAISSDLPRDGARPCPEGLSGATDLGQVWSIGLAWGRSPLDLGAGCGDDPVLTAADITDVEADFVADPFMVRHQGLWHLFFEVWNHRADKGEMALAQSPDLSAWTYRGVVLVEDWHLSYPHVFASGGNFWMVAEGVGGEAVRLYHADSFPDRWSCRKELIAGTFADPTPLFWRGRWWLFACPAPDHHNCLSLYSSDRLEGEWQEHPISPLVTGDRRRARPAGRMVVHRGRPIRWAQDCHPLYGTAVRAFEILELTPEVYRERELEPSPVLGPRPAPWARDGMHHVDARRWDGGSRGTGRWVACVDGCRVRREGRS